MDEEEALQAWAHQQELEHQEQEETELLLRMEAHAREFREWLEWQTQRELENESVPSH